MRARSLIGTSAALAFVAFVLLAVPASTPAADSVWCPTADPATAAAAGCDAESMIVPSLDPAWSAAFVPPPAPKVRLAAPCRPLAAVFWANSDWLRLAQKLRGDASACAEYYVSVPPFVANKTTLRAGEAAKIRALGPQMHAVADITVSAWGDWVAAGNGSWFDAGVEARRRMAAAGFDVAAGDIWGVNEFSSAVRAGTGNARSNMRDLVRGLAIGDGTGPVVQGVVWVSNFGQTTTDVTSQYKPNLKAWLQDSAFWADVGQYVQFFSQEVYTDVRNTLVPGSDLTTRRDHAIDFDEHVSVLSQVSPPAVADTKAFLQATDTPLANAVWGRAVAAGYGFTLVPVEQMEALVSLEVAALRSYQGQAPWRAGDSFGLAWDPNNGLSLPPADYQSQTGVLLDRMAASIHASDVPSDDPGIGACGPAGAWCAADFDGASFNDAWKVFGTWTQPLARDMTLTVAEDQPLPLTLDASDADGDPLTYEIVGVPQHGKVAGSGAAQTYTPAADFNGADSFTYQVNDGVMNSRIATVRITVTPVNDAPVVALDPAGPVDEAAAPVTLMAHATDVEGDPVTYAWKASAGTLVPAGRTATFAADDGPAVAHVTVTADDGHGGIDTASIDIEVRNVPPSADAGPDSHAPWGTAVTLSGSAVDPSRADAAAGLAATWNFGDGTPAVSGQSATHVYADPGTYVATLTATDKDGGAGSDTATVVVEPRPASVAYSGGVALDAASTTLVAQLTDGRDAQSARLGGHDLTMALGGQACTATTDTSGLARCTVDASSVTLGPSDVTAAFAGDDLYTSASATASIILYAMPIAGVFVVGDRTATGTITFWSPRWSSLNDLSGGTPPASFKGYADAFAAGGLRAGWTATPGFDKPPARVPAWMGVAVATSVTKDGSTVRGDTARLVVVRTDTYDPLTGGHGVVVATVPE